MGYHAAAKGSIDDNLRRAVVYGTVVASFCCEGFGLNRTMKLKPINIEDRVRELAGLRSLDAVTFES